MRSLSRFIPDPELLINMETEELAGVLLRAMKERLSDPIALAGPYLQLHTALLDLQGQQHPFDDSPAYPQHRLGEIKRAVVEAWQWLEAQGLLIPALDSNGMNGARVLSRRADKIETQTDFARFRTSRQLSKDVLHRRFADHVWSAFLRGEFDVAVFQAMKGVEVYVREASGWGNDMFGVALMQEAFKDGGPLVDQTAEKGERVARIQLFCGSIGSYKNPSSHRDLNLTNPTEATELILLANHLMRIVDSRILANRQTR
ncbi:TIGR02391 family protein [Mesorhizobium sp. M4B.F.Ca.ET.190.01.1.1]|uniref:TIGR02391 family protein n=1 Tax=unclassified Mesorhizobium TaxID=325217 RepID=UPI00109209E3|nr:MULTISPECIES: TIGR02391 family protein [unclassified Mesorhizobium]TGR10486.1 TIGR02391 family protein [Mesorhizobium sp. M4B.F.Ca.ET.200.01.1.1]TGS19576.1 TIGR02391 family protein [Mesorhizobium sp. M4B.F.Ca.ET.190.01.1.1]TGT32457.1 TIGR02391 family protein [Mesorhizobium sp. M4B.F.Ca.ET.172.01.1.1]